MISYMRLLKPPCIKVTDKIIYVLLCILAAIIILPSLIIGKNIREAILVYSRLMPKDLLIMFHGTKFIARKGKTDILILSEFSEPWMSKYFKPKKGDIVLDCGAHVGKYALPAAKLVGVEGTVIAIEPHPENYNALLKNINLNKFRNIIALNVAASDREGEAMLKEGDTDEEYTIKEHHSKNPIEAVQQSKIGQKRKADGALNPKRRNIFGTKSNCGAASIIVKTKTIDTIFRDLSLSDVDYMKIDVEGAEVEVLKGASEIIAKSPDIKILIEVWPDNSIEVDTILKELGCNKSEYIFVGEGTSIKYYFKEVVR